MNNRLKGTIIAFLSIAAVLGLSAGLEEYARSYVREKVKKDMLVRSQEINAVYEVPSGDFLAVSGENEEDAVPDLDFLSGWAGIAKYVTGTGSEEYETLHLAGVISIPALDTEEPIWLENTYVAMRYGVILMEDSSGLEEEGNSIIVGHRNIMTKTVFYNLTDIEDDDEVFITTPDGVRHEYRVNGRFYCSPYDLQSYVGSTGSKQITLVTCAREYGNTWRFIVTLVPV